MSPVFEFRPIVRDDLDELAGAVSDAFAAYREFAPADWQPPSPTDEACRLERSLADSGFWGELAIEGQTLAGHATFIPAGHHSFRPEQCSAHLLRLFVKP